MNGKAIVCLLVVILLSTVIAVGLSAAIQNGSISSSETQTGEKWPMFHFDLSHTGRTFSEAPRSNQTLWKFNTGGQMGSPVYSNGFVYVGSYDRKVYAFNASDGAIEW